MSIRDFFSQSALKQSAIEFLKNKADFKTLSSKYKKAFRGILVPRDKLHQHQPLKIYKSPFDMSKVDKPANREKEATLLVSDGFHSLPCVFSEECMLDFEDSYPSCIKIHEVTNMLVCVPDFEIILHSSFEDPQNVVDHKFFAQGNANRYGQ